MPAASEHIIPPQTIILSGPTASGKSEVALQLAERCQGEIVSADSMQVYRGLDIGTAKPTPQEQARTRHHVIDVVDPDESFDVARYLELATAAMTQIVARGKIPIVCGGTGFYVKALLEGIGSAPSSDRELRETLEQTPLTDLLAELEQTDPRAFESIDRQNPRRVVRAVEVIRLTGQPFSAQKSAWTEDRSTLAWPRGFVLTRSSEDLRARIDARVERMFEQGLVEETRGLMRRGLDRNATACQAIGYRQVIEHLNGMRSLEETVRLVQNRTWQLARRQMTWFRNQLPFPTLDIQPDEPAEFVVARLKTSRTNEQ